MAGIVDNLVSQAKRFADEHKNELEGAGLLGAGLVVSAIDLATLGLDVPGDILAAALLTGGLAKLEQSESKVVSTGAKVARARTSI